MKADAFALALALLVGPVAVADDLAAIAGHYVYDRYEVTLPNGKVLDLQGMGARDATLDIAASGTITLRMNMLSGAVVTQTARVLEAHVQKDAGVWVAQWPDVSYPVRAAITINGRTLTTETRFDNKSDAQRFGSVEYATLRKPSPL